MYPLIVLAEPPGISGLLPRLAGLPAHVSLPQMCHPVCGSGVGALLLLPDGSGNVLVSHSPLGRDHGCHLMTTCTGSWGRRLTPIFHVQFVL